MSIERHDQEKGKDRVAMGYPDDDLPANVVVSQRNSVDEATVFVGFDD